jgi:hypothetical protein
VEAWLLGFRHGLWMMGCWGSDMVVDVWLLGLGHGLWMFGCWFSDMVCDYRWAYTA